MNRLPFSLPTPTLLGAGAVSELPTRLNRLGVNRPLVVTDDGLLDTDAFQRIAEALGPTAQNREWFVYSGVHATPSEQEVRDAAQAFRPHGCDGIIGLGGSSPLRAGKAARLLVKRPGFDLKKFYGEPDWSDLPPFVAIPTTTGTGSEVGCSSVITLKATRRKAVLFHPELFAKRVILDPQLTVGLPPQLTAATGADANPNLAFAAMLAAGAEGVKERLDCGEEHLGNTYMDPKLEHLPDSSRDAADLYAKTKLARATFGDAVVEFYVHHAPLENEAFNNAVKDWERSPYFDRI